MENSIIYYADIEKETGIVKGFYCKEIHGENLPEGVLPITEELWQHLLTLGQAEVDVEALSSIPSLIEGETALGMEFERYFSEHVPEMPEEEPLPPSEMDILKDKVQSQGDEITEIKEMISEMFNMLREKQS